MHKILVIEPHQILRHAFAIALSPDYQVETVARFSNVENGKEPDLIIIDAAALQERGLLSASEVSAIQNWKTPVIWIDADEMTQRGESASPLCLKWPVEREALKKAVAACLEKSERTAGKARKLRTTPETIASNQGQPAAESTPPVDGGGKKLIELVDIVE